MGNTSDQKAHDGHDKDRSKQQETVPNQELLNYLWDEYKYRHSLCWQAVYKIVAVVVLLSVVPYIRSELTKNLGMQMLIPPLIGTLLAAFGIWVIRNELELFAKVKIVYHSLQDQLITSVLKEDDVKEVKEFALHKLKPEDVRHTLFDIYVHVLMIVLFLLSLGNLWILWKAWIPNLTSSQ